MKVLVTGGAGFIGHHLVAALLADGHGVNVIDDFSTGSPERLDSIRGRVTIVDGSILDVDALERATRDCEVVFHQAALPSVARSLIDPAGTNAVNVSGTINVMDVAARAGVRRVVMAGSSSVYGVPAELPCREAMTPKPLSPYGVSKLAAEVYIHVLGLHQGVETVALRYFNVFGPGQDPGSEYSAVIPKFVSAVLAGDRPHVNGNGEISRDFTYVDNVVRANMLAAGPGAPSGITCNIACGSRTTLLELLDAIGEATGREVEPTFGPDRPGDIMDSLADITIAQRELGYEVVVPFAEGITRTVEWYRDHPDTLSGIDA